MVVISSTLNIGTIVQTLDEAGEPIGPTRSGPRAADPPGLPTISHGGLKRRRLSVQDVRRRIRGALNRAACCSGGAESRADPLKLL